MWSYYSSRSVGTIASQSKSAIIIDGSSTSSTAHGTSTSFTSEKASHTEISSSTSVAWYGGHFSTEHYSELGQTEMDSFSQSDSAVTVTTSTGSSSVSVSSQMTRTVTGTEIIGFSRSFYSTFAISSQTLFSTRESSWQSASDSYNGVSSSWWSTIVRLRQSSNSLGGITTAQTSFTGSGTTTDSRVSYNYTTTTSTSAGTKWVTDTSTRESTFPTSTAGGTTTSTSSADTFTTEHTTTANITETSYATTWAVPPFYLDTIIEVAISDWAWSITTTGTGRVSDVAASFTGTITLTNQGESATVRFDTYDITNSDAVTDSEVTFLSADVASTTLTALLTSTQSTYSVAVGSNDAAPFTSTTVATISYTSHTTSSFTYISSTTYTEDSFAQSDVFTRGFLTFTELDPTTTSTGTTSTILTYSFPNDQKMFFIGSTGDSDETAFGTTRGVSTTENGDTEYTVTFNSLAYDFINGVAQSADTPSYTAATIGRGFQDESFGRGNPIGTNLAALTGTTSTTTTSETTTISASLALGWPHTDQTPILRAGESANIAGSVPTTLTNTRITTRFGGVGWESTVSTIGTVTIGIHQMTTQDSLGATGTTAKTWGATNSTYSLGPGQALAAEAVPLASVTTNGTYNPILSFSANDPS